MRAINVYRIFWWIDSFDNLEKPDFNWSWFDQFYDKIISVLDIWSEICLFCSVHISSYEGIGS